MATVPVLRPDTIATRPVGTPYQSAAGATAGAFGTDPAALMSAGKSLENTGDMLYKEVLRAQIEDNERETKKADLLLQEKLSMIRNGDGTPDNPGFLNLKGDAAVSAAGDAEQKRQKALREVSDGITNPKVKQMFEPLGRQRTISSTGEANDYTSKQRTVANNEVSQARQAGFQDSAIEARNNDARVATMAQSAGREAASNAADNGVQNPEVIKQEVEKASSGVYSAAIQARIQDDPQAAWDMYKTHQNQIDGKTQALLEKALEAPLTLAAAQGLADGAYLKYGDNEKAAGDYIKSTAKTAKERQAAEQQYEHAVDRSYSKNLHARSEIQWQQSQEDHRIAAEARGRDTRAQAVVDTVDTKDPAAGEAAIREKLSGQDEETAISIYRGRVSRDSAYKVETARVANQRASVSIVDGNMSFTEWAKANPDDFKVVAQDPTAINRLTQLSKDVAEGKKYAETSDGETFLGISTMEPSKLAKLDPRELYGKLTQSEYAKVQSLVTGAVNNIRKIQEDPHANDAGMSALRNMGKTIFGGKDDSTKSRQRNAAINEMNIFVAEAGANGKRPDANELNKEATRILLQVQVGASGVKGFFGFDSSTIAADVRSMPAERRATATVPFDKIPEDLKADISAELKKRGIKETNSLLEQIAGAQAAGDKARQKRLFGIKE